MLVLFLSATFAKPVDKIVAVVGNEVITEIDIANFKQFMLVTGSLNAGQLSNANIDKDILQYAINRKLQLAIASKNNIASLAQDKLIEGFLAKSKYSIETLDDILVANSLERKDLISNLHDDYIISSIQESYISNKLQVSAEESQQYLDDYYANETEYLLLDLFIPKSKPALTAAKYSALMNAAVENAKENNDVAAPVVKRELGWRKKSDIPAIFQATIKTLQEGNASKLIIADNGLHVLLLQQLKNPVAININDARHALSNKKASEILSQWLTELKSQFYIKIY